MEQKLYEAASGLPETALCFDQVTETERLSKQKGPSRTLWRAMAACLALVLCLGLGIHAYRAEAQEYADALAFFQANGLSVEGLTRAEIKAVYKDISTKSFTYSKTGQVIQNSLTQEQIEGFEILQPDPSPEDVENLWNYKQYGGWFVPYEKPKYQWHIYPDFDEYYFEKNEAGETVWTVDLPFRADRYCEIADGVIAYGVDQYHDENDVLKTDCWMAKIDHSGNLLWVQQVKNGFDREIPHGVLENDDGTYALFSRGDNEYLCVSIYSAEGERILYRQTHMGQFSIGKVAHYADGYLLQTSADQKTETLKFIRVDQQGNVMDGFSYFQKDYHYYVQDMVEHGGKVYISAYTVPKLSEDENHYGRAEIARILQYVFGQKKIDISNEELTPLVRANYKAVLLVCDPKNGGKMETFYTVNGSLGMDLIVTQEGQLIWETESIVDTFFSIATSSFTIGGQCYVYQYFFDEGGNLFSVGKSDRVTNFRR
mgnify:CR=1 FL=1